MSEDLIGKIRALRSQKEELREMVLKSVDGLVAERIKGLKNEGIDVDDPRVQPLIREVLESFKRETVKKLLDQELREIDEKIEAYSKEL